MKAAGAPVVTQTCEAPIIFGDTDTRVLLAVVASPRPLLPAIARQLGRSKSTVYFSLLRLRGEQLVGFEDGRKGTIRPLVRVA